MQMHELTSFVNRVGTFKTDYNVVSAAVGRWLEIVSAPKAVNMFADFDSIDSPVGGDKALFFLSRNERKTVV